MKKILIFEDDKSNLDVLFLILEGEYQVLGLSAVNNFLESVSVFKPDLIFCDVELGRNDGRDLCKQLKQNIFTRNIPFYLLSASNYEKFIPDCGADGFIAKPYEVSDILAIVNTIS